MGNSGFEGLDGAVWLRTSFELPAYMGWEKIWYLDLNRIRDHDLTYVNGKLVGTQESNEAKKICDTKRNTCMREKILLLYRCLNYFDKGGITGYKDTPGILVFIREVRKRQRFH